MYTDNVSNMKKIIMYRVSRFWWI